MDILGSLRVAIAIAAGLLRTTNRFPDVLVHLVLEFGAYLWEEHHTITVVGTDNQVVLVDGQCVGLIARVQAIAQDWNTIAGAKAFSVIHGIKVARAGKKKVSSRHLSHSGYGEPPKILGLCQYLSG
jgi:hypothetical protein